MIDLPSVYDHQQKIIDDLREALRRNRRVILCASTGFGKSRCAKWLMGAAMNKERKDNQSGIVGFTVHRRGLVDNIVQRFEEDPRLPHGVIMSGVETAVAAQCQVSSIDTLLSWYVDGGQWTSSSHTYDLIVVDESHSHHPKYVKMVEAHDRRRAEFGLHPAYVIGLSATPEFTGNSWYGEIVTGPTTQWLIDHGYASPFRYMAGRKARIEKLQKRGGEFTKASQREAFEGLEGDFVRDYLNYAYSQNLPTVGFFTFLSEAQEAQRLLRGAGVRCEYVDGKTPDERRRSIYWELENGRIDYIANVGVIERGTDIPQIGCIQICTATASLVRYRQIIGRGSRVADGKTECLVIDHGSNIKRHEPYSFFEDEVPWMLENTKRQIGDSKGRPTIECPQCQTVYRGGKCCNCGYEPTPKQRKEQGLVFDGQRLKEITKKDRAQRKVMSNHDIMVRALFIAGHSGRTWKQAIGIAYGIAKEQRTQFKVPKHVTIAGQQCPMVPYGHPLGGQRVRYLFPWTVGDYREPCWHQQKEHAHAR